MRWREFARIELAARRWSSHYLPRKAVLLLLAGGCAESSTQTQVRDSAGVTIVEETIPIGAPTCSLASYPSFSVGGTVAADEPYIVDGVTDAVALSGKGVAIALRVAGEVRLYDSTGAFVRSVGRHGGGPGEFRNLSRLWVIAGDTLVVADYRPWRLQYFTLDGRLVREVTPTPRDVNRPRLVELLHNGVLVQGYPCCLTRAPGFHAQLVALTRHDRYGRLLDTLGVFPYGEWGQLIEGATRASWTFPLFESFTSVSSTGSEIIVGAQSTGELLFYRDAELATILRWRFAEKGESRVVTQRDVDLHRANRLAESRPEIQWMINEEVSESRPFRSRFPAFVEAKAAFDGSVWVRGYKHPSDQGGSNLHYLFNSTRRFVCVLRLDAGRSLLHASPRSLLLLETGEYDIQRVAHYAFTVAEAPSR